MLILVGCEESQTVCKALRLRGHEAYSCDIMDCSGGRPEWHIKGDIFAAIASRNWDMGIFFPPCTHLAVSGAKHFEKKRADGRQRDGIEFFLRIANCGVPLISIENPVGIMSGDYIGKWFPDLLPLAALSNMPRKPDQIIQPYQFGDRAQKSTCLWLKGLPKLQHTNVVDAGEFYTSPTGKKMASWCCDPVGENGKKLAYNSAEIKKVRSKTFQGIADAMADQWTNFVFSNSEPAQSLFA